MEIAVGRETQYRRVLIRNTQDDKLFKVNVDLANWTEDALYALAGRHMGLAELVSDHYAKLHGALDQELQNTVTAEVEDKLDRCGRGIEVNHHVPRSR